MNKKTIGLAIIFILIISGVIYLDQKLSTEEVSEKDFSNEKNKEKEIINKTNPTKEINDSLDENKSDYSGNGTTIGSGGTSRGGSSDNTEDKEDKNTVSLPEDINTSECGIYYEEYNECRGTCPEGVCVRGGPRNESCFCQKKEP